MALHATNKLENIKSSIEKYVFDNLSSTISVDWQGNESTDIEGKDEWMQPRIMKGPAEYCRQVTNTTKGANVEYLININIFLSIFI